MAPGDSSAAKLLKEREDKEPDAPFSFVRGGFDQQLMYKLLALLWLHLRERQEIANGEKAKRNQDGKDKGETVLLCAESPNHPCS